MCGLYSLTIAPEALKAALGYVEDEQFAPRPVIRPGEPVAIVRREADGLRHLRLVLWGLLPHWAKDPKALRRPINARAETLLERPFFRGAIRHRRCILPADGFHEWTGERGRKRAVLFRRHDGAPMYMAGLWEQWLGADGSELETAVVITVDANADVSPVHERMPALLTPEEIDAWLDPSLPARETMALLRPAPPGLLKAQDMGNPLKPPPAQPRLL